MYNHLVTGAEKTNNIGTLVLTDFAKAFDMVTHTNVITCFLDLGVSPAMGCQLSV